MFIAKYSHKAKLFAALSIAIIFGICSWQLLPIAAFIDHSIKGEGLVIGTSDSCTQIQYEDSTSKKHLVCENLVYGSIGSTVELWYIDSKPGKVLLRNPLLQLLKITMLGLCWFASVIGYMWWYSHRLENLPKKSPKVIKTNSTPEVESLNDKIAKKKAIRPIASHKAQDELLF